MSAGGVAGLRRGAPSGRTGPLSVLRSGLSRRRFRREGFGECGPGAQHGGRTASFRISRSFRIRRLFFRDGGSLLRRIPGTRPLLEHLLRRRAGFTLKFGRLEPYAPYACPCSLPSASYFCTILSASVCGLAVAAPLSLPSGGGEWKHLSCRVLHNGCSRYALMHAREHDQYFVHAGR